MLLSSYLIGLLAYLAAMIPGPIGMLTEKKLGVAEKQTGTNPSQNSHLVTYQVAHILCKQSTMVKRALEKVINGENWLLSLRGQLHNALQQEKVGNHNYSLFIHRDIRMDLVMSMECFEAFGIEAFYKYMLLHMVFVCVCVRLCEWQLSGKVFPLGQRPHGYGKSCWSLGARGEECRPTPLSLLENAEKRLPNPNLFRRPSLLMP